MKQKFTKLKSGIQLKTNMWTVKLVPKNGHIHASISGPMIKKRFLTSITDDLSYFEYKVVALYIFKLGRDFCGGSTQKHSNINYAEIFGACYE